MHKYSTRSNLQPCEFRQVMCTSQAHLSDNVVVIGISQIIIVSVMIRAQDSCQNLKGC